MQEALIEFVGSYGYFGLALLIFIENVFPPIPSEAVLLFGGFMTIKTDMSIIWLAVAATIGSLAGAVALYALGAFLGKERLKSLLGGKIGRALRLKPESVDKAESWFSRYGGKAVLICRCIPIVRSLISIPAGMAGMRLIPFLLLTTLGSAVWNTVIITVGALTGSAWESCIGYFGAYTFIAAAVIGILVLIAYINYRRKNKES